MSVSQILANGKLTPSRYFVALLHEFKASVAIHKFVDLTKTPFLWPIQYSYSSAV